MVRMDLAVPDHDVTTKKRADLSAMGAYCSIAKRNVIVANVRVILLSLLAVIALAGCHRGEDVTVDGRSIILHPSGAPTATITANGSFSVGQNNIKLSPAEHTLFTRYYDAVAALHHDRDAMKKAGMAMAGQAVHLAGKQLHNALAHSSSSEQATKQLDATIRSKGEGIKQMADKLCREVHQVDTAQSALNAQVGAFKAYANIDATAQVHCDSWNTASNN